MLLALVNMELGWGGGIIFSDYKMDTFVTWPAWLSESKILQPKGSGVQFPIRATYLGFEFIPRPGAHRREPINVSCPYSLPLFLKSNGKNMSSNEEF